MRRRDARRDSRSMEEADSRVELFMNEAIIKFKEINYSS
jgi:hypothetical protein